MKSLYLSLVAVVLLMASCSQEELAESKNMADGLALATTSSFMCFDEDVETRSTINPTGSSEEPDGVVNSFMWQDGDQLGVYGGGEASGLTNFDLIDGCNTTKAQFKANGFSLMPMTPYYAFTPYDGTQIKKTRVEMDFGGQVQTGNGTYDHLGAKDFQHSPQTTAAVADANRLTNFQLKHDGALCRFRLTVPDEGVFTEFKISGITFASKGWVDLTINTFYTEETGSIVMELGAHGSGINVHAGEVLTLYMMLPKQDLSKCTDLAATLSSSEGKQYITKLQGKKLEGGGAYGWTEEVKEHVSMPVLSGLFSVSATKKVRFTTGNLWWDGSDYHFEANQTDYPQNAAFNPNHVGHFFWTNVTDYQSGESAFMPYATTAYAFSNQSVSDKFFCDEANPLTVDGIDGYFALTIDEWYYITRTSGTVRANADKLRKLNATVDGVPNCLILAPDDYDFNTKPLKDSYTLEEANELGLLCLPPSGYLSETTSDQGWEYNKHLDHLGELGYYWSSTPDNRADRSRRLNFGKGGLCNLTDPLARKYGCALRLVKKAE
ncbi:MAG: fimbrillin family protein [Bacteroidaceae bacterium]|nr:fimbrillin family protein [Bacteroidaceae bacterium]